METTRHFTGTVYVVNDGATALHDHDRLGLTLPPGGHVDRDELLHQAALRECREETGLEPTLLGDAPGPDAPEGRPIPRPRYQMLYDIDRVGDDVAHQHVDAIYYATVPSRELAPAPGEPGAAAWRWYDRDELRATDLAEDVVRFGTEAIDAASKAA